MPYEPRFATLIDVFDEAMRSFGARQLFGTKVDGTWRWITYADFGKAVEGFRAGLASLGVSRGDRVAIVSDNRVEWAVAAYACYGLGASFVPMYEAQSPKEWQFIVRDCEAKILLVASDRVLASVREILDAIPSVQRVVLIEAAVNGHRAQDARVTTYAALLEGHPAVAAIRPDPADVASLIYTSGTTGDPKGVMLTHRNIASNVSALHEVVPTENEDRSLSFLPWAHVFGQTCELHGLMSGGASIAICESVNKILDDLAEVKPTVLFSVPRVFNKIYTAVHGQIEGQPKAVQRLVTEALKVTSKERSGERLKIHELALLELVDKLVFSKVRQRMGGRLKYAVSGGAALSLEVAEFIDSMGITVYEGYGLTETSPIATANVPGSRKIGSVGRPLPGIVVDVDPATAERRPAEGKRPARVEGEIVVYGPNVMKGYLHREAETSAVLTRDGGLRTGDMGYIDAHGFLFITGRIKEQYKLENGKYVVPTPIEEAIKLSPYVQNAMVYGDNRPNNVAIVVADLHAVRKWAAEHDVALPGDDAAVLQDDRVRALFRKEIDKHGVGFKGFETVVDFALVASDFTTENGMLTPSLKVKRRKVVDTYQSLIDAMYAKRMGEKRAGQGTQP